MSHDSGSQGKQNNKPVVLAIFALLVVYLILLFQFNGAFFSKEETSHEHGTEPASNVTAPASNEAQPSAPSAVAADVAAANVAEAETKEKTADADAAVAPTQGAEHVAQEKHMPPYWMALPFALLLLAIAILPLIPATEHWWESNLHRFLVAAVLGLITLAYYSFFYPYPVEGHWHFYHGEFTGLNAGWAIFTGAIMNEFIPFIVLLFALFTIAGGIRISGDLKASPLVNTTIMFIGGVLASFIGTTGAAMLLVRLLLETNKQRKRVAHTVIFFIFIVCNCGGCLLPIGDPPLFLGYLRGVPFLWTFALWKEWMFVNFALLIVYFLWDSIIAYPRETASDLTHDRLETKKLTIEGLFPNGLLLLGIVLCVAMLDPSKAIPGTTFTPPQYLREICQLVLVALSLMLGSTKVREENSFNYGAIIEVAALFFGIFICMQAPLQILNVKGGELNLQATDTHQFFWATGCLSSVLDNAPTYVVFYETGKAVCAAEGEKLAAGGKSQAEITSEIRPVANTGVGAGLLAAISLGAVMMGAMTYIGNGPNFMVKAIAEQSGVKMPSFFGYMVYSICILFPILLAMTFIFL